MTDTPSRREELIAAALADELSEEERREFERACAGDPTMVRDLHALQETAQRLDRAGLSWQEQDPPPGLGDRILAATTGAASTSAAPTHDPEPEDATAREAPAAGARPRSRSRTVLFGMAAAGLLAVGTLGGALVGDLLESPPEGPPGTLGAVEDVTFPRPPAGGSIDAALIAHTWGTETVLEVDGLGVGDSFEVVLVREDGQELTSGSFLGAEETITCRMNAAVLREDVSQVQIRDATGAVMVSSQVSDV